MLDQNRALADRKKNQPVFLYTRGNALTREHDFDGHLDGRVNQGPAFRSQNIRLVDLASRGGHVRSRDGVAGGDIHGGCLAGICFA